MLPCSQGLASPLQPCPSSLSRTRKADQNFQLQQATQTLWYELAACVTDARIDSAVSKVGPILGTACGKGEATQRAKSILRAVVSDILDENGGELRAQVCMTPVMSRWMSLTTKLPQVNALVQAQKRSLMQKLRQSIKAIITARAMRVISKSR